MVYILKRTSDRMKLFVGEFSPWLEVRELVSWAYSSDLSEEIKHQITSRQYFITEPADDKQAVPDLIGFRFGPYIVSPRVKEAMEELEQNTFQFVPVHVVSHDHEPVLGKTDHGIHYVIFNIPALDAIIVEETDFEGGHGVEGFNSQFTWLDTEKDVVLDETVIEGHHFWRGAKMGRSDYRNDFFCSQEFYEKIILPYNTWGVECKCKTRVR